MTLEYTPQLIDYRLQSFNEDGKHYVTGYLIGTKTGDKGWGVHKDTFIDNTKAFKGFPFIVSPKKFDPTEHYLVGKTYEEQIVKQKPVIRGEIEDVLGPFPYNDGTDDIYMKFKARVDDKEISEALLTGRLPFGTSPYIWPTDEQGSPIDPATLTPEEREHVKHWIPVHEALVTQGTFGDIAKIGKQCLGPQGVCTQALAGSSNDVAEYLSSQIHSENHDQSNTMSDQTNVSNDAKTQVEQVPAVISTTSQAPIKTPVVEETEVKENVEVASVKRELAEKDKIIQKLLNKDKQNVLSTIFVNFEDEDTKKATIKKYMEYDVDVLSEFAADVLKYGIPKKVKKDVELAGSSKEEKETFPLTGNSKLTNQVIQEQSLTNLLGGPL